MVPVLVPGQAFRDSDLGNLTAALRTRLLDEVTAFFRENSFTRLTTEFQVFGHDVAPRAQPLQLPRALTDYWNPRFEPGGFDAAEPGVVAGLPVVFDGTERLELDVRPRERPQQELEVSFSALSAESTHGMFPVTIAFAATDALQLRVTDRLGIARQLDVSFTDSSFSVNAASVGADLAVVASYLSARIEAATAALNLPGSAPALLQPVRVRRIRGVSGTELGRLVLDLSVDPDYGDGSASVEVVSQIGLAKLGLDSAAASRFIPSAGTGPIQNYLIQRLQLAQEDKGFSTGNQLLRDPTVTISGDTLTTRVRLSDLDGGAESSVSILSQTGLGKIGFDSPVVVPGVVTAGESSTVRDSQGLINDVLTLVNDALGGGDQTAWLTAPARDFRCIYVVFLGTPPLAPPTWDADPAAVAGLRMFRWWATAQHNLDADIELLGNWITSAFPGPAPVGTACHELAHTLGGVEGTQPGGMAVPTDWCFGLPDTYDNDPENQNQLRYFRGWDLMSSHQQTPHLAGYHKRHLRWIPATRIHRVVLPDPTAPTAEECWLVPVEHWDVTLEADVRAAVGGNLPIRQLMEITLPGAGARFLLVEARAAGTLFSQNLPFAPGSTAALLVSDGIACSDPERYVVDSKYRRYVHPLNVGSELDTAGEAFDLATAPELAHEGTVVRVVARQDVRGGTIPVLHTRVERVQADFIDLHFTDANPPWRNPDVWIDWPGNGRESYPVGTPYEQGDKVRFRKSGTEPHLIVARVHNKGTVAALNVNVRFYIWEPAGCGDKGKFCFIDNQVLPSVDANSFALAEGRWPVTAANNAHQCLLVQISDWEIPQAPGGGPVPVYEASTDLWLHNNRAQKNIVDFELISGSPYEPYELALEVANSGPEDVLVYLEPVGLAPGYRMTCKPRTLRVPARGSSQFVVRISADTAAISPQSHFDNAFVLHACRWSRDMTNVEAFGGWQLVIRPREATTLTLSATSTPPGVQVTGILAGGTAADRVWVCLADSTGQRPSWRLAPVQTGGAFTTTFESVPVGATTVQVEAHFDGNSNLASATAGPITVATPGGHIGPPGGGGGGPIVVDGGVPIGGGGPVVVGPLPRASGHHTQGSDDDA
ncbi:hypothetical protein [Streptomyces sp. PSKA30]|uniref:hypothetical protein n=1 Tax=Streptomyces sp. PSKA30 TaxID=2874597 RepID=UPI001CD102F2|nr:hypothetical protein [Streptomyces sp. PSKA30]MBZ9644752.1 hypothetical protein [Streptomyces sp. PSKA30]